MEIIAVVALVALVGIWVAWFGLGIYEAGEKRGFRDGWKRAEDTSAAVSGRSVVLFDPTAIDAEALRAAYGQDALLIEVDLVPGRCVENVFKQVELPE